MDEPGFFASHGRAGRQPGCQRQEKISLVQNFFFKKKIIVVRLDVDDADIMFPSTTAHVKLNYGGRKKKRLPTAPGVPRRSPIQVLTGPDVA